MRLRSAGSTGSTARDCHSIVWPTLHPDTLLEAVPSTLGSVDVFGSDRVWTVATDDLQSGWQAARLREAERVRPLAPGVGLRCVLLRHIDGAEVVLVADRGLLPHCCVLALAVAIAEAPDAGLSTWNAHRDSPDHRPGSGVSAVWRPIGPLFTSPPVVMAAPADTDSLVTAVGQLCAAVLRQDQVDVAVEDPESAPRVVQVDRSGTSAAAATNDAGHQVGVMVTNASPEVYLPALAPPYPITVICCRADDGSVRVRIWVETDEVESGIGEVIATHLTRRLVAGRTAAPDVFLLAEPEAVEILRTGCGPEVTIDDVGSVCDAFAAVVGAYSQRNAITGDGIELAYGELDEASRAVASALVEHGVRVGERVGVCMEPTPLAIVALLAVLRAGACYVPLDPTHPGERRAYMVRDAGLRLVITDTGADAQMGDVVTVTLDELRVSRATHELPLVGPDDPAYVIYTSGTTGWPKGVVIPHRNILALIAATRREFELAASDVWTLFHSLAFDFSVWEIWGCLLTAGRLVVVPYWTARTPSMFGTLLREQGVTVLSQTPSAFVNLVPVLTADDAAHDLRLVIFGGEALRTSMLAGWLRRFPSADCRLVNMYGITETTVHVTWHDVTATDVATSSHSVGRPLPGWSVSVRTPDGRILPFDVAGELCIGGAGLALGYHGRPELTEERFLVDPASGTRYYRSGDLGRLRPDGTIDHLGRLDDQAKIRGHRVELGEIRAALLDDPAVRDAVVAFHEDDEGSSIRAYVIGQLKSVSDLRGRLRKRLPEYMIPATLHAVTEFPLTANGKADLAALAAYTEAGPADVEHMVSAPTSDASGGVPQDLIMVVHRAWAGVFGEGCVDTDFFDLGGNSLMALRLSSALDNQGYGRVSPQDIYLNPSTTELIAALSTGLQSGPLVIGSGGNG